MDRITFDRLLVQHLPAGLRMAVKLTGDTESAEDVVHDAVVRAVRAWQGFRGDAAFSTWWLAIVINVWRDGLRRRRIEKRADGGTEEDRTLDRPDEAAASPIDAAATDELARTVAMAVSQLPPREREVIVLVAYERMTAAEAAAVLGLSEQNVRTTLSHGRDRLKQKLKRHL